MAEENKGGSDLDIFEGLGKKTSERNPTAPPPPPGSSQHVPAAQIVAKDNMKKTLLGMPPIAAPSSAPNTAVSPTTNASPTMPTLPNSGSVNTPLATPAVAAAMGPASARTSSSLPAPPSVSKPPPPPGRGSLPKLAAVATGLGQARPSTAPDAAPNSKLPPASPPSNRPTAQAKAPPSSNGASIEMDWDDEDAATSVFDREIREKEAAAKAEAKADKGTPDRANIDAILSAPPRTSVAPAAGKSSAPPPPPVQNGSGSYRAASGPPSGATRATLHSQPPMPVGQTTTSPMNMPTTSNAPPPPPPSIRPQPAATSVSSVPPASAAAPAVDMPPVSRAMEATAMVPRPAPSRAPMLIAVGALAATIAGGLYLFFAPRPGTLVVNVADAKGSAVKRLEIYVDNNKKCDSAPCIVRELPSGIHEVKVTASGFEQAASKAVTIDGRHDATIDFPLVATKTGGTGFTVQGHQPGVKLSVDGQDRGALPQDLRDLTPGEHKLRFASSSDRYTPLEKTIQVAQDEVTDLGEVALKVVKGKATIQLGTPGAKVSLVQGKDRKEVPAFPMAIEFDPNEHWQLEATKDGFEEYRQPISFDDGQAEKTFTITLSPKSTAATMTPPHFNAPVTGVAHPYTAPPAPKPTTAAAGSDTAAATGESFLNINSLPASTVVLDGKPLGATPKVRISVTPGVHKIIFVNAEQSLKKEISVNVAAGETKPAFAKLRE